MFKTLRNLFLLAAGIYVALRWLQRRNARAIARTAAAARVPSSPAAAAPSVAASLPLPAPPADGDQPPHATQPASAVTEVAVTAAAPEARGNVAPRDHASVFDAHIAPVATLPVLDGPVDDAPARAVLAQLTAALREAGDGTWMVGDDAADDAGAPTPSAEAPAAPPAVTPDGAVSGTFTVTGVASGPRQVVMGVVAFPRTLTRAPVDWQRGGAPRPGVLVLDVETTANCRPETVGVVFVNGYAPSADGFTVRVVSDAAGPFTAAGRFTFAAG